MSRGQALLSGSYEMFSQMRPNGVFTTSTLCQLVYNVKEVRKKHRVAVLKALKRLAHRSMPTLWRKVQRYERDDLWYDYRFFPGLARDRAPVSEPRPRKR